jgi:putative nucleotidyltransferase with HDIG domain
MARRKAKPRSRLQALERLGVVPRRGLRQALRPGVSAPDAAVAAAFVLAVVLVLNYGVLVDLAKGQAGPEGLEALAGSAVVVAAVVAMTIVYLERHQRRLVATWRQLLVLAACCLLCVVGAKALVSLDAALGEAWSGLVYLTPLSAFAILFGVAYGQREAIAASIILSILVGLSVQLAHGAEASAQALPVAVVLLAGGLVAVLATRRIRKRLKLLNVGVLVAGVHVVVMLGFELLSSRLGRGQAPPQELLWGAANGVGVGVLLTVSLPLVELVFNVATEIRLLELSDQEQPLLRYLMALAPSTDNHSRRVAILSEAAAEAIGANSLLARVASFYHDIGKMTKPDYFIENIAGDDSPHDDLRPTMSSLIIAAHTKDGVELAEEAKLPRCIIDIIAQHHGTSTIEYFYNRYLEEAGERPRLDQEFFRYPGAKPTTKEAAIVMLADSVEAASRTLAEPVPSRIERLVRRITTARLLDGQLEECALTLSELRRIERAFVRVLCSMYHARIEYPTPDPERAPRARNGGTAAPAAAPEP